jgi:hypothetical protein
MARKPNYRFERKERDRRKAEKKAAKLKAKAEAAGETEANEAEPGQARPETLGVGQGRVAEEGRSQTDQSDPSDPDGLRADADPKV